MQDSIIRYGDLGQGTLEERPSTFADLLDLLGRVREASSQLLEVPYVVDLLKPGFGRLSIGLGNGKWILSFASEDESSYLYSLGDASATGTVAFYFGSDTLLSRKYLINRNDAIEAIRKFFESGELGDNITWTEEIFPLK